MKVSDDSGLSDDFVSIPDAARLLGIGERRAYRIAARLSDSDKQLSDTGRVLVRQVALSKAAGGAFVSDTNTNESGQLSDTLPLLSDISGGIVRHPSDTRTRAKTKPQPRLVHERLHPAALLAEKDARIAELAAALEAERDAHKRAELLHLNTQGELQALRNRAAALEAQNGRLIEDLPVAGKLDNVSSHDAPVSNGPQEATEGARTGEMADGGSLPDSNETPRPWWQFWRKEPA